MISSKESEENTQIILDDYKSIAPDQDSQKAEEKLTDEFNQDIETAMKQNYSYPEASDPELQYKTYIKREFYAHKIPPRPDINNYNDIKEYRDNICARDFTLHEHQAMLSNFINPDTPYRGILCFHGTGTGKCLTADGYCFMNGYLSKMRDIWKKYTSDKVIIDTEGGEWSIPKEELIINSINNNGKIIKKRVKRLYREKVNTEIKEIVLENGYKIGITQIHKLLKNDQWTNDIKVGDIVEVYEIVEEKRTL